MFVESVDVGVKLGGTVRPDHVDKNTVTTKGKTATLGISGKANPSGKSDRKQDRLLQSYTVGATAAQTAQIDMIRRVFVAMDSDGDGLLSASDVKAYFTSINRPSSDAVVRKWIRDRDIDQDGAVSLVEFVSSFAFQLDPSSIPADAKRKSQVSKPQHSHVAAAFGCLRLACSPQELVQAVNAATNYVQRVLDSPSTKEFWRIHIEDAEFRQNVGRLFGGEKLMLALGFEQEDNGKVLALRDPRGGIWDIVPLEIRQVLGRNIQELQHHKNSLLEPSVSNIAAGNSHYCAFCF
jgi:hypothetical protein